MMMNNVVKIVGGLLAATIASAAAAGQKAKETYSTVGSIEVLDAQFKQIISPAAKIEKLADGFKWVEGPAWVKNGGYLLFSDVPNDTVFKWKEGLGVTVYLKSEDFAKGLHLTGRPAPNGLVIDHAGRLVICLEGDRQIARQEKSGEFTTLADYYTSRRFNSPNDAVYHENGSLYFTDPPFGLEKRGEDPRKELLDNGVYRLSKKGEIQLVTRELSLPNGLAFSPDYKVLYVADSDAARPSIVAFDVKPDGGLANSRIFFDATELAKKTPGSLDGLKVDKKGNVFCVGPGGVLVISSKGKHLGTIVTGQSNSNCAWGDDGSVLYIGGNPLLVRVKTLTQGVGF
jgi:gluconolactonase